MNTTPRTIYVLILALVLTACGKSTVTVELAPSSEAQVQSSSAQSSSQREQKEIQTVEIPRKALLDVPFTPQAPHANWEPPYDEACEEASMIMVDYYLRNEELSREQANREIVQLTNWEQSEGYAVDVTVAEMKEIIESYYNYTARISDNVSVASIMYEVAQGNPVIIPAAGRQLGNPYFSGEGPPYHMLVIVGYDSKDFIAHDPGTKRGEEYKYPHNTIINAIHDWTGSKDTIEQGAKKMLIIEH